MVCEILFEHFLSAGAVKVGGGACSYSEIRNCPSGKWGRAVPQVVEALRYKSERRNFDS